MPIVAVAGGIASAVAGAAAIGTATGLAAVVAGVQIVSGVASALGAVTGNKTLMKIGMVGAAVSGGLSIANSLSGGGLLGTAAQPADMMGSVTDSALSGGGQAAADVASTQGVSAAIDAADAGISTASKIGDISDATGVALSATDSAGVSQVATQTSDAAGVARNAVAPGDINANWAADMTAKTALPTDQLKMPGVGVTSPQNPSGGLLASFQDFMHKNPSLVKVGSETIGGMGKAYMASKEAEEKARIAEEARRRYNLSITNQRSL